MLSKNNAKILLTSILCIFLTGCSTTQAVPVEEIENEEINALFTFQNCSEKNGIRIAPEMPGFIFEGEYYIQNANTMVTEESLEHTDFFLTKWLPESAIDENYCVINYTDGQYYGNHQLAKQEVFRVKEHKDEKIVAIKSDDRFYFTFAPFNEENPTPIGYELKEVLNHMVTGYIYNSPSIKINNFKILDEIEYQYMPPVYTLLIEVDNSDFLYFYSIFTLENGVNVIADDYNEKMYTFSADFQ